MVNTLVRTASARNLEPDVRELPAVGADAVQVVTKVVTARVRYPASGTALDGNRVQVAVVAAHVHGAAVRGEHVVVVEFGDPAEVDLRELAAREGNPEEPPVAVHDEREAVGSPVGRLEEQV